MATHITAYMAGWCSDCWRTRRVLLAAGVPFEEIDVDRVSGAAEEMRRINGGSDKVPTVVVGDVVLIEPTDFELNKALAAQFEGALQEA